MQNGFGSEYVSSLEARGEYLYLHEQNLRDVSFGKFKGDLSLAVWNRMCVKYIHFREKTSTFLISIIMQYSNRKTIEFYLYGFLRGKHMKSNHIYF